MCGILCLHGKDVDQCSQQVKAGLDALTPRGPDAQGSWTDGTALMAHTRLAVVAPESGKQPIVGEQWILSINGEVYNHEELAGEDDTKGGRAMTDCFAVMRLLETLPESATIQEFGSSVASKLNGMWAFAAYDRTTQSIWLARDPIGIVPLYYGFDTHGRLWISSLLAAMPKEVKPIVFPPGHVGRLRPSEQSLSLRKWTQDYKTDWVSWQVAAAPDLDELRAIMTKAVTSRLMGHVPWGVLLSGGLDSSIVAAIAAAFASKHRPDFPVVHSFCIGLVGSPDHAAAQLVADHLGTHHTAIEYTLEDGLEALKDVIRSVETYAVTTIRASTPMWLLGKALRTRGIKHVLSGEGSDELYGGYLYNWYCPTPEDMVAECVDKMDALWGYDLARANKSLGDHGVEARVPFLDPEMVDYAMRRLHPVHKMSRSHPTGSRAEKWVLREAFRDLLPGEVTDRVKAQFSDAVGSGWIGGLKAHAEQQVSDDALAGAAKEFPHNTPATKEAYLYRTIFAEIFPHGEHTVLYTPESVACSTARGADWGDFDSADPSGDVVLRM